VGTFNDVRNFGTAKVVSLDKLANNLAHVGLGVLDTGLLPFDLDSCLLGLGKRWNNKSICELLLDQSVISGIGNYGKVEALYRAGISPWRKISSLSLFQVVGVYLKAKEVYEESYKLGGCTLRDFKRLDGSAGHFQDKLQVYKKKTDLLGNKVVREKTPDGRTSFWVPEVQS
jgi:formamidopyrimidine-DNA glycosylase